MYRDLTCRVLASVAVIVLCGSAAWADYEAGRVAWQAGRHAEALAQWREAARADDGKAMLALGRAFAKGLGVPQDYILAHMWLNLAAGRGNAEAARERDTLAASMTPQHIASAQERARAWLSGRGADAPKAKVVPRAAAPSAPAGPPPPRAIREAQALMTALGYKPGPADGLWGTRTGGAYAAFLRDAGLPPGNLLTPEALRAMRTAAKGRNVTASAAPPRPAPATQRKAAPPPAELHRLVAAGDIDGLKAALAREADANIRDSKGWTPLMLAADKGKSLLIPPLLEAGADPDLRLADGATAMFIATVHGHSEIVAALMEAGADFLIKGPNGDTAADAALAKFGALEAAREKGEPTGVLALLQRKTLSEVMELRRHTKQIIGTRPYCISSSGNRLIMPWSDLIPAIERGHCEGLLTVKRIGNCDTRNSACNWPCTTGACFRDWKFKDSRSEDYYRSDVNALIEAWLANPQAARDRAIDQIKQHVPNWQVIPQR